MGILATAIVNVESNLKPLQVGLAKAKNELVRFSSEAKVIGRVPLGLGFNLRTLGLVSGAGGLVAALGQATKKSSALGESLSKVKVVFGGDAESILSNTERLANQFGVVRREALDAASAFGLMGRAAGLSAEEQAKMANEMVNLGIDLASFHNLTREEAFTKLRAGLAGEAEPLRPLGIMLSEDAVKAEALATGLVSVNQTLTDQEKIRARISIISRSAAPAIGDAERTAGSTENIMRKAMGDLENFTTKLGSDLEPALVSSIRLAEELGKSLSKSLTGQKGVFETAASDANRVVNELRDMNAVLNSNVRVLEKIKMIWDVLFRPAGAQPPGKFADTTRGIPSKPQELNAAQIWGQQVVKERIEINNMILRAMGPSLEERAKSEMGPEETDKAKRARKANEKLRAHMRRIQADQDALTAERMGVKLPFNDPLATAIMMRDRPQGFAALQRNQANKILERMNVGAISGLNVMRNLTGGPINTLMGGGVGGMALATGFRKLVGEPKSPEVQEYTDEIDRLKEDLKKEKRLKAARSQLGLSDRPSQLFADPADFAHGMVQGILGQTNDQVKAIENSIKILEAIRDKLPDKEKVERHQGLFPRG